MPTPRGWYDVGDGWAGLWDGQQWTGERISHEQLAALTRPTAPPPPMTPPPPGPIHRAEAKPPPSGRTIGVVAGGAVGLVALIGIAGAVAPEKDKPTAATATTTRQAESPAAPAVSTTGAPRMQALADALSPKCEAVAVRDSLLITLPDGDEECANAVGASLVLLGFSRDDVATIARTGDAVTRGDNKLSVFRATDGLLVGIDPA